MIIYTSEMMKTASKNWTMNSIIITKKFGIIPKNLNKQNNLDYHLMTKKYDSFINNTFYQKIIINCLAKIFLSIF